MRCNCRGVPAIGCRPIRSLRWPVDTTCQSSMAPVMAARPAAPAAVQPGTPPVPSGTVTQCCPAGRCQRNAHTPLARATSWACMGPASWPMKAMELAVVCSSVPAVGVMTNQTSVPLTGVLDVRARAWTSSRPENGPRTPWEATTSSDSGICADTLARVAAVGPLTRSQCAGTWGPQTMAQPRAWATSRAAHTQRDPAMTPGQPGQHGHGAERYEHIDGQQLERRLSEPPPGRQDRGQQADGDQGKQWPEQDADCPARQQRSA